MSSICMTSILLLLMLFSSICLHRYDRRNWKEAYKARPEECQYRISRIEQKAFWNSDLTQPKALVVVMSADSVPRATEKRLRSFLRNYIEGQDIIIVLEQLPKRSGKLQEKVPRLIATKNKDTLKSGKQEKDEEEDHPNGKQNFNVKQIVVLPNWIKDQAQYDEKS